MIHELDTRYGKMLLPDNDIGQYVWLKNTGASPEHEFIDEVCILLDERSRECVVDVGASFGCWTLPLAKHARRVIAIEPQKCVRQLLIKSCAGLKNITIVAAAAGSEPGNNLIPALDIEKDTNFGGIALGIPHTEQPDSPMDAVQMVRLDDLLKGELVSFIKIDVEGFEQRVLAGASKTIVRCKPILFIEVDHPYTDKPSLLGQVESLGYVTTKRGGNILGMPL